MTTRHNLSQPFARFLTLFLLVLLMLLPGDADTRRISRRLIIHVPIKVKTHHHMHTVYKHLHTTGPNIKQTVYKILGYSPAAGSSNSHDSILKSGMPHVAHSVAELGKVTYENMYDCQSGHLEPTSYKDMKFNHFSRHDDEYPDEDEEDEFVGVEQSDWF